MTGTSKFVEDHLLLLVLFIAMVSGLGDWWNVYEFNADEGGNLQKAALVANGHVLYSEIWSDQPPVLTYLLAAVHHAFPFSVTAARTVILLFAALSVVCLFQIVRRFEGRAAAWVAILALITGKLFWKLSVSVMIGLPAIALTLLAINILTMRSDGSRSVITASGAAVFALAVCTKFFVLVAVPSLIIALSLSNRRTCSGIKATDNSLLLFILSGLFFLVSVSLSILAIFMISGFFAPGQLLQTHVAATQSEAFVSSGGIDQLLTYFSRSSKLAYLAVIAGLAAIAVRPYLHRFIPFVWFAIAVTVLSFHRPLWSHHLLLVIVPACWMAGIFAKDIIDAFRRYSPKYKILKTASFVSVVLFSIFVIASGADSIRSLQKIIDRQATVTEITSRERIRHYANNADLVVTGKPIDAYYAGKLVVPSLAVWSSKRMNVGKISEAEIISEIDKYRSVQVLLRRFTYSKEFLSGLRPRLIQVHMIFDPLKNANLYHFIPRAKRKPGLHQDLMQTLQYSGAKGIGGYWDRSIGKRYDRIAKKQEIAKGSIVARPPGSAQEIGACFTEAWKQTRERIFLAEALRIAEALTCVQTKGGGWAEHQAPQQRCLYKQRNRPSDDHVTFDDGTSVSVLYFASDLKNMLEQSEQHAPFWLDMMIRRGTDYIVQTQRPDGSWPQSLKGTGYHSHATLNDDVMTGLIRFLIYAYRREGNRNYLNAARKAGDYLLRVQKNSVRNAFGQQYDQQGQIASARKFEPAAHSSLETAFAVNALIDLNIATGDRAYLEAARKAAAWLRQSQITKDRWARLYSIESDEPIFADREGRIFNRLDLLPPDERLKYRWVGDSETFPDIETALKRLELRAEGVQAVIDYDNSHEQRFLFPRVPTARISLNNHGKSDKDIQSGYTRDFIEYCVQKIYPQAQHSD